MKQYLKFLSLVWLSALLMAGCGMVTDGEYLDRENPDILSFFGPDGKAWLRVEIPVGSAKVHSRTDFSDGQADDYAIHHVMLVLFHGTAESNATVASTYQYTSWEQTIDDDTQVTALLQVNSDNIEHGDNIYLMAVINATPAVTAGMTFSEVAALTTDITVDHDGTDYYVMTNAPVTDANDGTGSVSTLVYMPPTYFFQTEEEARLNPATTISVERAAAKVTVDVSNTLVYNVLGNQTIDFEKTDVQFSFSKVNNSTYLVRHVNAAWLPYHAASTGYRMIEESPLPTGYYRLYWAEDPNYENGTGLSTQKGGWNSMGKSMPITENTTTVGAMTQANVTAVVVRIRVNGAKDFYTTSITGSDVIYQPPQNNLSEEGTSANQSFAPRRSAYVSVARTIDEYLRQWLWQTNADFRSWVNTYAAGELRYVNIGVYADSREIGGSGVANIQNRDDGVTVTQTARESGTDGANAFDALNLNTYIKNNIKINYYWQGYMFYRVPIRHFTDEQTPWASEATMSSSMPAAVYGTNNVLIEPDASNNYLGRYGVVRNNWYTVTVRTVNHVGEPIFPIPSTTDACDGVEQLLNTTLVISNWNEHEQDL